MSYRHFIFFIITVIFSLLKTIAQVYPFTNFSSKNGLPHSIVNQVYQDSKGNIWFATQGGLDMFNGYTHKKFNKSSGLVGINITSVAEDKNGAIWIGTTEGVSKYYRGNFINYTKKDGLNSDFIYHIMCDSKNQIWLSTNDGGITVIKDSIIKNLTQENGLTSNIIFSTYETSDKKIWVGTRKGGICVIDNFKVIKTYNTTNGFEAKSAFAIFEDSKKNIWIGTNGKGLFKYTNGEFNKIRSPVIGNDYISAIQEDHLKTIWVATETKGLLKISQGDTSYLGVENGLSNLYVTNLLFDKSKNLWVSTNGNGVNVLKNTYLRKIILKSTNIGSLVRYSNNNLLAITSGIEEISNDKETSHFSDIDASSIYYDEKNNYIWIAIPNIGLGRLIKNKNGTYYTDVTINDSIFENITIVKILKVKENLFWAFTFGKGIIEFDNSKIIRLIDNSSANLPSNNLLSADININNDIWIGTSDVGAIHYNGKDFKLFKKENGLKSTNINAISCDKKGNIYIGTSDDGLYCYTNNKLIQISLKQNLVSEQVTALSCDADNSVWVGTNKGISHLKFNDDFKIDFIHNYSESHGFNAMEVNPNGIIACDDKIAVSSVDGLYLLIKKLIPKIISKPHIIIDQLKINSEVQNWHNYTDIDTSTSLPKNLLLNYKQNRLTFEIKSLDFKDINELQYSYYLEGFDEKWSDYSLNREIYYSNLNHGKYTLHVKAKDISGVESNEIIYSFVITPPFYKTWWFITLCITALIFGIYFYIKTRTYKLVKEKQILEERVAQRTEFIEKQKHEIEQQKEIIEEKNKEVIDSITYARRIQRSMLSSEFYINKFLKDYFILFKPKDIVSGDFYWIYGDESNDGIVYVVTADCTGHGVPGGFMSMMGINLLKEIIQGKQIDEPSTIVNILRKEIIKNLNPEGSNEETKDGMDMVLCKYDFNSLTLEYTAANNALYLYRNGTLTEYKGDKMPVGVYGEDLKDFSTFKINLHKNDIIYTTTDGFPDQFGGPKGRKFMYKRFENMLIEMANLSMHEQKNNLKKSLTEWTHHTDAINNNVEYAQVDDITVLGIKI